MWRAQPWVIVAGIVTLTTASLEADQGLLLPQKQSTKPGRASSIQRLSPLRRASHR
jgi:hypothetical protein